MNNVSVLFCGDFAPCRRYESLVIKEKTNVLGDALKYIKEADISFVNLECPLTNTNSPIAKSGPALKSSDKCIEALAPFSVVGLANNHILDHGKKGLSDTMDYCRKASLATVGAGLNQEEAQRPYIKNIKGLKVAIIAIAEHEFNQSENNGPGSAPIDAIDNYKQIKEAKELADIVIVTLHGGNEYFPYPRPGLRKLCKYFVDLGVDGVICHHPHVPGSFEYYQGMPIVYSLGNFVFDNLAPPQYWDQGYMALLNFDMKNKKFKSFEFIPYKQSVDQGGIKLLEGNEKKEFITRINTYNKKLKDTISWLQEWDDFIVKQRNSYLLRQYLPLSFKGIGFLVRKTPLLKLFINQKNILPKANMLKCQSHLEVLKAVIENEKTKKWY